MRSSMLKKISKEKWLCVPNALTAMRILLTAAFLFLYTNGLYTPAIIVFVVAAATDMLDGYAARKLNQITNLGKLLDPIADKFMIIAALCALVMRGWCPVWMLAVICAKEALMLVGGMVLLGRGIVIQAILIGKVTTVVFLAAIALTFFHERTTPYDFYAQILVCALNVSALIVYAKQAFQKLKHE